MSPRERVLAAIRLQEPDRKPNLAAASSSTTSDLVVFDTAPLARDAEGPMALVRVANPFGRALTVERDLGTELRADPERGGSLIGEFASECRSCIERASETGAEGLLYVLSGASPERCTPMVYGGFFLESDRELLAFARSLGLLTFVFVAGAEGAYLDMASDLPADAFGWDAKATGVGAEDIRRIRTGAVFTNDPLSDILLDTGPMGLTPDDARFAEEFARA